jgi:hypothetical protein
MYGDDTRYDDKTKHAEMQPLLGNLHGNFLGNFHGNFSGHLQRAVPTHAINTSTLANLMPQPMPQPV